MHSEIPNIGFRVQGLGMSQAGSLQDFYTVCDEVFLATPVVNAAAYDSTLVARITVALILGQAMSKRSSEYVRSAHAQAW